MIALQDQDVLQGYFNDLLMKPLAKEVEKIAEPLQIVNVIEKIKKIEKIDPDLDLVIPSLESDLEFENTSTEIKDNYTGPFAEYGWENNRPPWAQTSFDCLLFEVCGFNFAVPLITLGKIQPIGNGLTPIFGQEPWMMGLQKTELGQQRVINTAVFFMPDRFQPSGSYKLPYMITIAECPWALAVDRVKQPIRLSPEEVKWSLHQHKQSWLGGIVKKQMCVLVDIPALARQLYGFENN